MSYFVKEFVLPKNDSKCRENILLDMVNFEQRFRKYIKNAKCENEIGHIIVKYYVDDTEEK